MALDRLSHLGDKKHNFNNARKAEGKKSEQDIFTKIGQGIAPKGSYIDSFEQDDVTPQELLDEMYNDSDVIDCLDTNGNGVIDADERQNFENYIQGDDSELTSEAIEDAYTSIKNGTFKTDEYNEYLNGLNSQEATNPLDDLKNKISNALGLNGSNGSNSSGGGTSGPSSTPPSSNSEKDDVPKNIEDMSRDELEDAKKEAQDSLDEKQSKLSDLLSGGNNDADLAAKQKEIDDSYENYRNMLSEDEELQGRLDEMEAKVSAQEADVDQKDLAVSNQEQAVSAAESAHDSAVASVEAAQAAVDSYEGQNTDEMSEEEAQSYEAGKQAAQQQLEAAQAAEQAALENLNQQKDALEQRKAELEEAQAQLDEVNAEKEALDAEIVQKHPEVAEAQQAYNDAKSDYNTEKQNKVSEAKDDVSTAQETINKIDSRISELDDKQKTSENSFNPAGNFFNSNLDIDYQYFKDKKYAVIGPKDADPDKEYPVIVYLHGYHDGVEGEANITQEAFIQELTSQGYDMANFNGYIICPTSPNGWDNHSATSVIDNAVNDFASNHSIDRNNISLVGHSMGGWGALYQADAHLNGKNGIKFTNVATISPQHSAGADVSNLARRMGVRGYTGQSDNSYVRQSVFKNAVGNDNVFGVNGGHATAAKEALLRDDDGDGISDLLKWLVTNKNTRYQI